MFCFSMQVQIYKKKRFKTIFVHRISIRAFLAIFVRFRKNRSFRILNGDFDS